MTRGKVVNESIRLIWISLIVALSGLGDCFAAHRVFLLSGQSNMVGYGYNSELLPPYSAAQNDVQLWNSTSATGWVPLSPGFGKDANSFGPEVAFGRAIKGVLPNDTIYLVKYADGGEALYNDFSPDPAGLHYGNMLTTFWSALANLDAAGIEYEISGMLWMQGESDAYEGEAASYETNLVNFIDAVRTEFTVPAMPFIIGRVLDYYGGDVLAAGIEQTDPTQAEIVRTA